MPKKPQEALVLLAALAASACATSPPLAPRGMAPVDLPIDLERFAGDWFVIAHLPTSTEAAAYDAVESYALEADGGIDVRFRFCDGAEGGPERTIAMSGWVTDPQTNARWRVRPVWPLALAYHIVELDPDYRFTVVTHPSKSYAWIMARTTTPSEDRIDAAVARLAADGFDLSGLRRVPHTGTPCASGQD